MPKEIVNIPDAIKVLEAHGYTVVSPNAKLISRAKGVMSFHNVSREDYQLEDDADVEEVDGGAWVTLRLWVENP